MIRVSLLRMIGPGLVVLMACASRFPAEAAVSVPAGKQCVPSDSVKAAYSRNSFLRTHDRDCNGVLDESELSSFESPTKARKPIARVLAPPPNAAQQTPLLVPPITVKTECPYGWSFHPIIRDAYDDLSGVLVSDCPPSLQGAKGAQVSWTHDGVALNTQWLFKGVAAGRFLLRADAPSDGSAYLGVFSVAPTVRFQRVVNSKLANKDIDVLAEGISSEAFFDGVIDPQLQLYVRARANANGNFEGAVNSFSGTLQVQPVYYPLRIGTNIKAGYVYINVAPLVSLQYFDHLYGKALPLFAGSSSVLRAGPSVQFSIVPYDGDIVPEYLRRLSLNGTYTWYEGIVGRLRSYEHFEAQLTYNVTENFGFSLGYEGGRIEETGARIDLATAGLTVKY